MKPKLVDNWRQSWRWYSQQAFAAAGALQGTWMMVPDDLKSRAPDNIVNWVTLAILTLGFIGRYIPQGDKDA